MSKQYTTIQLEPELFGEGATAQRKRPIRMRQVARVGQLQGRGQDGFNELCKEFVDIYPQWSGIIDEELGELPNLSDSPNTLLDLTPAQFQWLGGRGLVENPIRGPKKKR